MSVKTSLYRRRASTVRIVGIWKSEGRERRLALRRDCGRGLVGTSLVGGVLGLCFRVFATVLIIVSDSFVRGLGRKGTRSLSRSLFVIGVPSGWVPRRSSWTGSDMRALTPQAMQQHGDAQCIVLTQAPASMHQRFEWNSQFFWQRCHVLAGYRPRAMHRTEHCQCTISPHSILLLPLHTSVIQGRYIHDLRRVPGHSRHPNEALLM